MNGEVLNVDVALANGNVPRDVFEAPLPASVTNMHDGQEITPTRECNPNFRPATNQENGQVNGNGENSSRTKGKRKQRSPVWEHFTYSVGKDGREWASCNRCKKNFGGSSQSGTTHLRNHLKCCRIKNDLLARGADKSIEPGHSSTTLVVSKKKSKFDQQLDVARMIMKYWGASVVPVKDNILDVYQEEKEKFSRYLTTLSCCFHLTISYLEDDLFSMDVYFIDDRWKLKKLTSVFYQDELKTLILDWKREKIRFFVNDSLSFFPKEEDDDMEWFESIFSFDAVDDVLLFILVIRWWRSLTDEDFRDHIPNIWDCVKRFRFLDHEVQIVIDVARSFREIPSFQEVPPLSMQMNHFDLLEWAIQYKEVLCILDENIGNVTEEWQKGAQMYMFLNEVKNATASLLETLREKRTINVYFPLFCDVNWKLLGWEKSEYGKTTLNMGEGLHKYLSKFELVLATTAILDPRFKLDIVQRWYQRIYGNDADTQVQRIMNYVTEVYNEYAKSSNNSTSSIWGHGVGINSSTSIKMLDAMGMAYTSSQNVNDVVASPESGDGELNRYLQDSKCCRVADFDILDWWHSNSSTYPTVARMARDYLSIPISCDEDLDSSLKEEIINTYDCDFLDDDIKQALIFTKAWWHSQENN